MTAAREPWWSSGVGPDEPPLDEHDDPVAAHRAARRGQAGAAGDGAADGDGVSEGDGAADGGGVSDRDGAAQEGGAAHVADVCGVCPICLGARVLGETRPELLAHLTEAARHLAAAARTLLDEDTRASTSRPDPDASVTRIDLD